MLFRSNHNAYDFYALCREGEHKEAEFQCKGKPANLKEAQCKDRPKPEKGLKQERSSAEDDPDDSEYQSYYYLKKTTDKKYCYDCEQRTCILCVTPTAFLTFAEYCCHIRCVSTGREFVVLSVSACESVDNKRT